MPIPEGEEDQTPKCTNSELKVVLEKAGSRSWVNEQIRANYKPASLEDQARYYEGLRSIEPRKNNKNNGNKKDNNYNG